MSEENTGVQSVSAGTNYEDDDGEQVKLTAEVTFNFGGDLTEAVELYGEGVVYERYVRGVKKDAGNAIRAALNRYLEMEGDDAPEPDDIPGLVASELASWRPDVVKPRGRRPKEASPEDILKSFDTLSPEAQAQIIAEIQARVADA